MSASAANGTARWKYDAEQDVLYISRAHPQPSFVVEDDSVEGLHIRYSMSSKELVGAVVLYFSYQDKDELRRRLPFAFDFDQVEQGASDAG